MLERCTDCNRGGHDDSQEANIDRQNTSDSVSTRRVLSFKDFKGFKKTHDILSNYTIMEPLGKGSFGEVRKALHIKAEVVCAMKIIKKKKIQQHQILVDLMHNELQVLEECVRLILFLEPPEHHAHLRTVGR